MPYIPKRNRMAWLLSALVLPGALGCNGLPGTSTSQQPAPQTYLAPIAAGDPAGGTISISNPASTGPVTIDTIYKGATVNLATYTIDDTGGSYVQTTTSLGNGAGTTVDNSGTLSVLPRNLRSLNTTYQYPYTPNGILSSYNYNPPLPGSYAVELAGQAGALVQLVKQPAVPLAATQNCPEFSKAQTFQYITLPDSGWSAAQQTAFGSVEIATSGTAATLSNIQQFTLPSNGNPSGTPTASYQTAADGACSLTPYGNTVSVPTSATVTNSGTGTTPATPPAILGIGPSGFMVESYLGGGSATNNLLGAGTGAVGVPQPSAPLGAGPVTGPQYLGFIYGTGGSSTAWSSTIASFGFSTTTTPTDCSALTSQTPPPTTLIYGGDFPLDPIEGVPDPGTPKVKDNGGFPLYCDLAIDLGPESSTSNGLYPTAKVWLGSNFIANGAMKTYWFPAVAIAGQLQGKFVILVIGQDNTGSPAQAWAIYLMQSN